MKKFLLVFLGASGMIAAQAQTGAKKMFRAPRISTDTRSLVLHANGKALAARTTAAPALTSIADYESSSGTLMNVDTGYVYYSHGRTSAFDFSLFEYSLAQADLDLLESDGNPMVLPVIKGDSAVVFETGVPTPYVTARFGYDNNNKVIYQGLTEHQQGIPDTAEYARVSRDAQSRATQLVMGRSTSTFADTASYARLYYNAQSKVDRDTTFEKNNLGNFQAEVARKFAYKSTGLIDSVLEYTRGAISLGLTSVTRVNGTPANLVRDMSTYDVNAIGARSLRQFDTMAYDPTNSFTVYDRHDYYSGTTVALRFLQTKHLNASGLPDSVIYTTLSNGSTNSTLSTMEYNADKSPRLRREYSVNGTTRTLSSEQRYYYNGRTGVAEVATTFGIAIVPNPSNGVFSFRSATALPQGTTCMVYDLNGRRLNTFAIDEQHASIDISMLNAGIYILQLSDANGRISLSRQVEKQ